MKLKSVQCDLCKFAVGEIDKILASQDTEDAIMNEIDKICHLLDDLGLFDICHNLIQDNLHNIIDGLVNNQLSPENVCKSLSLC